MRRMRLPLDLKHLRVEQIPFGHLMSSISNQAASELEIPVGDPVLLGNLIECNLFEEIAVALFTGPAHEYEGMINH